MVRLGKIEFSLTFIFRFLTTNITSQKKTCRFTLETPTSTSLRLSSASTVAKHNYYPLTPSSSDFFSIFVPDLQLDSRLLLRPRRSDNHRGRARFLLPTIFNCICKS